MEKSILSKELIIVLVLSIGMGWILVSQMDLNSVTEKESSSLATMCCRERGGDYFYQDKTLVCRFPDGEIRDAWEFFKENCRQQSEENNVAFLLILLSEETGISFSQIEEKGVEWRTESKEDLLSGKGFGAEGIPSDKYNQVHSFFRERGFKIDPYNIAAGTISELTGYKGEGVVCTVTGGVSGYQEIEGEWDPREVGNRDLEVRCAELEKN
ncbi:MAG: hypothetical protein GF370_03250 [Candidatus Nealsonbacteria bacterium]|nr:hypothetical protein [Candidatus Nealsonbacteria bacterium]